MSADSEVNGFGSWYDLKQGDEGDLWHRTLIDPGLLGALGDLSRGTRLLDVGCGNGYLSRRLARRGAHVVGIDVASALIRRALAREADEPLGITYLERDASDLHGLGDGSFDVAFANMSLMNIPKAKEAIGEVGRVVRDEGRFVFSISHPCFDVDTRSSWCLEAPAGVGEPQTICRKVTAYREPHSDVFPWMDAAGKVIARTTGYHRPLSWYAAALREAGWAIVNLAEPRPTEEFVGRRVAKEWIEAIPLHLVVDAWRMPRHRP